MTPEELETLRKLRSGELVYTQENFSPSNLPRRALPETTPKAPPPVPKKES